MYPRIADVCTLGCGPLQARKVGRVLYSCWFFLAILLFSHHPPIDIKYLSQRINSLYKRLLVLTCPDKNVLFHYKPIFQWKWILLGRRTKLIYLQQRVCVHTMATLRILHPSVVCVLGLILAIHRMQCALHSQCSPWTSWVYFFIDFNNCASRWLQMEEVFQISGTATLLGARLHLQVWAVGATALHGLIIQPSHQQGANV